MTTEDYAKKHLFREIKEIENSHRLNVLTELTVYEKAIIYKYSEDGYVDLNEKLRLSEGEDISIFGLLLDECLSKLPDYQDVVYRGDSLTESEIKQYNYRFVNQEYYEEYLFFSSSKSRNKAYEYAKPYKNEFSVIFTIFSKRGKDISSLAKYEIEREILFRYNSRFNVINIEERENVYFIILKEI